MVYATDTSKIKNHVILNHVIKKTDQRQPGVQRLLPLAVGVQALAKLADAGCLGVGGVGKGEGFEAAGFYINRIVADTEVAPTGQCPNHMNFTGQNAQKIRII